jgi:hypothetical protein
MPPAKTNLPESTRTDDPLLVSSGVLAPTSSDSNQTSGDKSEPVGEKVPTPTLERLTIYLRCLIDFGATGAETISSAQIEQQTGISAAQFRKAILASRA